MYIRFQLPNRTPTQFQVRQVSATNLCILNKLMLFAEVYINKTRTFLIIIYFYLVYYFDIEKENFISYIIYAK